MGEELGAASALKQAANSWVAGLTALAGQALGLTRAAGLDPRLLLQSIGGGPTDAPYLQLKGTAMIGQNFSPAFTVDGVRKDVALMTEQAGRDGVSPALLEAMAAVFARASDRGHGADDMAAVVSAF